MSEIEIKADMNNLESTVKYLSEIYPFRHYRNVDSLDKSAAYITETLKKYRLGIEEQEFMVQGNTYRNIMTHFGPPDAPRIIIGAHYDVCGNQPGADDNASAVAGLLELARLLKPYSSKLKYRIDFVAYSLEESPFFGTKQMGSYIHARSLKKNDVKVRAMISLEMIGFFSDEPHSQDYPISLMKLI